MNTMIKGILINDNTDWQDEAVALSNLTNYVAIANAKIPKQGDILAIIQEALIKSPLEIFYIKDEYAYYKAYILDFATSEAEFIQKSWANKYGKIAWYYENFADYKVSNKKAAIVFLVTKFKKLEIPIDKQRFVIYSNYKLPTQDNIVPYIFIKGEKLSKISFNGDFFQFSKNFELDLTYPKGHDKQNQPLDKVCILGQSGTGKTSLLKIMKNYVLGEKLPANCVVTSNNVPSNSTPDAIYFPLNSIDKLELLDMDENINYTDDQINDFYDFEIADPKLHWYSVLHEVKEYQKKSIDFKLELMSKIENSKSTDLAINTINEEFEQWNRQNKNPLKELNVFLKPLLDKLFIRIKDNPKQLSDLKFIPIEGLNLDKNDALIPLEFLSSGTKQILVKTVPLFYLKPEHTIIMMDEPENSLYPDVQREMVQFVIQETWHTEKNCQFFFATHSPTIASLFEPWEIIKLKFNSTDGKVYQEKYYEGERHINNYFKDPKLYNWNAVYLQMFEIKEEVNKDYRQKAMDDLKKLEDALDIMAKKGNTNTKEYNDLFNRIIYQRRKLGFDY